MRKHTANKSLIYIYNKVKLDEKIQDNNYDRMFAYNHDLRSTT